jgi:hypothetical protein
MIALNKEKCIECKIFKKEFITKIDPTHFTKVFTCKKCWNER